MFLFHTEHVVATRIEGTDGFGASWVLDLTSVVGWTEVLIQDLSETTPSTAVGYHDMDILMYVQWAVLMVKTLPFESELFSFKPEHGLACLWGKRSLLGL